MEDYRALRAYNGSRATAYDDLRFRTWRGRLVDRLEWRLLFRGISALMTRTGRLTSVVDVPAGTGRMTVRLARSGLHVVAVDASADMLAIAEARGGADGYVVGRIEQLPQLVASADGVVSLRLFGHLPVGTQATALRQIREVARIGAVICFAADTPWLRLRRAITGTKRPHLLLVGPRSRIVRLASWLRRRGSRSSRSCASWAPYPRHMRWSCVPMRAKGQPVRASSVRAGRSCHPRNPGAATRVAAARYLAGGLTSAKAGARRSRADSGRRLPRRSGCRRNPSARRRRLQSGDGPVRRHV